MRTLFRFLSVTVLCSTVFFSATSSLNALSIRIEPWYSSQTEIDTSSLPPGIQLTKLEAEYTGDATIALSNPTSVPLYLVQKRTDLDQDTATKVAGTFVNYYKLVRNQVLHRTTGPNEISYDETQLELDQNTLSYLDIRVEENTTADHRPDNVELPPDQLFEIEALYGDKPIKIRGRFIYSLNPRYDPCGVSSARRFVREWDSRSLGTPSEETAPEPPCVEPPFKITVPKPGFLAKELDIVLHTFFYVLAAGLVVWLINLARPRKKHARRLALVRVFQVVGVVVVAASYYYSLQPQPPMFVQIAWLVTVLLFSGFSATGVIYYGYMSLRDHYTIIRMLGEVTGIWATLNGIFMTGVGLVWAGGTLYIASIGHPLLFLVVLFGELASFIGLAKLDSSQRKRSS